MESNFRGMPAGAEWILIGLILLFLIVMFVVKIFYILTLQKAFSRCAPQNQVMSPGLVWLLLIPLFTLVWHFFVVLNLAKSLGQEFRERGILGDPQPGKTIGLIMCICAACGMIPYLGILTALAGVVLWIVYWVQIADFSRRLI